MDDRLKCVELLDEMHSDLNGIVMQWDNRRYSTLSVIKKIERLQENISDFNSFYLQYIARTKSSAKDREALMRYLTPEQD